MCNKTNPYECLYLYEDKVVTVFYACKLCTDVINLIKEACKKPSSG